MMAYVASEGRLFALKPSEWGIAGRRGALRICNAAFLIASRDIRTFRFGSLADILRWLRYVRFTPESGHRKPSWSVNETF